MKKGLGDWLATDPADIICFQEVKANKEDVDLSVFEALGYHCYWFAAEKKGYSGVAICTKLPIDKVHYGNGNAQSDAEGRIIRADIGDITLLNGYFPSGTSGDLRQDYKYQWLEEFFYYVQELRATRPQLIICGDYNIAHKEIDIHNPVGNKKSSGFLPEERQWMDRFFESGFIDTLRVFPPEPHLYTWWSQRFPSVRAENKGWRIDYFSTTENLRPRLKNAAVLPDVKHSDHCPIFLEIAS